MTQASKFFAAAAQWTAQQCGRGPAFALACLVVIVWAGLGPVFHFSDTWQLVINTGTTIVTFLMVFLLQNAQIRDSTAIQLKLDELIRANRDARNKLLTLEDLTEEEMQRVKDAFARIAAKGDATGELTEAQDNLSQAGKHLQQAQQEISRVKED